MVVHNCVIGLNYQNIQKPDDNYTNVQHYEVRSPATTKQNNTLIDTHLTKFNPISQFVTSFTTIHVIPFQFISAEERSQAVM